MAALTAGVAEIRAAEASAIPDDAPAASMPLAKLYQYAHCALLYSGAATKWAEKTPEEKAEFDAAVRLLKEKRKVRD